MDLSTQTFVVFAPFCFLLACVHILLPLGAWKDSKPCVKCRPWHLPVLLESISSDKFLSLTFVANCKFFHLSKYFIFLLRSRCNHPKWPMLIDPYNRSGTVT